MRQTFEGTVYKAELRQERSRFSYDRERYDLKAMVAFTSDQGEQFWFFSPATSMSISQGGPYTVVVITESDWIGKKDWTCKGAMGAAGFGDAPVLKVKVGDRIKVDAKIKGDTRYGKRLWFVRREQINQAEVEEVA